MRATERVEVRFTRAEMYAIRALAITYGYTATELVRMGTLTMFEEYYEGDDHIITGANSRRAR